MTKNDTDPLIKIADFFLILSLVVVGFGVAVVVYLLTTNPPEALKPQYPTWESAIKGLRKDCDRIDGGEMVIIKNTRRRAIIVQCDDKNGNRIAAYTLDWTGVDTTYRVRAFYHSIKYGRN